MSSPIQLSVYRKQHSTKTAIMIVHNDIMKATDDSKLLVFEPLDRTTHFVTVDLSMLTDIMLHRVEFSDSELNWIQSYNTNCTFISHFVSFCTLISAIL